jgi:hypothetical protein
MKVGKEKRKKSFYILGYQLELIITNLAILDFCFFQKSGEFGAIFLAWKILLCRTKFIFFRAKFEEIWRNFGPSLK